MEPGLYLTFFSEGEAFDKELPPVGPLEHVVVRDRMLVADRKDGQHAGAFDGGGRHIDAEYEFQRATGNEPGGARRPNVRVVAPEGVYLRFVSFGSEAEHDPIPELGPYAVVVITKNDVEADGDRIANRTGGGHELWELTHVGGSALTGTLRPDIAFRTRSTAYHPQIKPFRPARHTVPVAAPAAAVPVRPATPTVRTAASPPRAEPDIPRPVAPLPPPRAGAVVAPPPRPIDPVVPTLRARLGQEAITARSGAGAAGSGRVREWGGALWRLRIVVLAALILLVAAFSVPSIRSLFVAGTPGSSTVGIGSPVTSANWTYSVGSVRRVAKIGSAQARGIYLVVQVATTNRGTAGAQPEPSTFSVVGAEGQVYSAESAGSGVYSGTENPNSSYAWPSAFPVGRSVVATLIFDVPPSISGAQLVIPDVPTTRVRLE